MFFDPTCIVVIPLADSISSKYFEVFFFFLVSHILAKGATTLHKRISFIPSVVAYPDIKITWNFLRNLGDTLDRVLKFSDIWTLTLSNIQNRVLCYCSMSQVNRHYWAWWCTKQSWALGVETRMQAHNKPNFKDEWLVFTFYYIQSMCI